MTIYTISHYISIIRTMSTNGGFKRYMPEKVSYYLLSSLKLEGMSYGHGEETFL